jgi:hypothetical protein
MDALAQFLYSAHRLKSRNISLAIIGSIVIKIIRVQLEVGSPDFVKRQGAEKVIRPLLGNTKDHRNSCSKMRIVYIFITSGKCSFHIFCIKPSLQSVHIYMCMCNFQNMTLPLWHLLCLMEMNKVDHPMYGTVAFFYEHEVGHILS